MAARLPSAPESSPQPRVRIPKQTTDPTWSLKPWPVVVTMAGREYRFPEAVAADWLAVLMRDPPDLDLVISEMAEGGPELLLDESLGDELYEVCLEAIAAASGRPWYQALRLIQVAVSNWNVLGAEMLYRGFLPHMVSLSAWLDVLLLVTIRAMDPKDVTMFTLQLERPPTDEVEAETSDLEMSRDAFLAMGR